MKTSGLKMAVMYLVLCLLASSVVAVDGKGGVYGVGFPYVKGGAIGLNPWGFGVGPWGYGGFKGNGFGYPLGWGPYGNPWGFAPWGYPWGIGGFGKK